MLVHFYNTIKAYILTTRLVALFHFIKLTNWTLIITIILITFFTV